MTTQQDALRLLVAKNLMLLDWRHHANGILQAYLVPGRLRVHIWHDSLVRYTDGEIHNHRRDFEIDVLAGSIENTPFVLSSQGDMERRQHFCVGASSGHLEPSSIYALNEGHPFHIGSEHRSSTYTIPAYHLHRARSRWAVTLVRMGDPGKGPASIYCDRDHEPRQAFDHPSGQENPLASPKDERSVEQTKAVDLILRAQAELLDPGCS